MKVLLVNGSPHERGCTYTALEEIREVMEAEGVATEIFQVGRKPVAGCTACHGCEKLGKCVFDDKVNEFVTLAAQADGFVFGSPVHYAAMAGSITAFMDRVFYSAASSGREVFYLKPAAGIVSARRGGTTAAFEQINKYFTISQMPVISSQYWNMVHGHTPEEVRQDLEGLQTMRTLARNMVWFLRCREVADQAGVPLPEQEERIGTNFIR